MNEGGMNPGRIMALVGGFWLAFTIQAGVKLGIFTIIGQERLTGHEVAQHLGGDVKGVTTLLNALTAMEPLKNWRKNSPIPP